MASPLDRSQPPAPGPVRRFDFPAVTRDELANGLGTLGARHGDLPLVTAAIVMDAGAECETAGTDGLGALTAASLETGTGELGADDVAWELERLGVELQADVNWDAAELRMTVPVQHLEPAMQIFAALVRAPSFPQDEVRRLRDEQLAELMQRRKEPGALANDMANRFIFGAAQRYGRPLLGTDETLARLERPQVEAFHEENYGPAAGTLILVGDLDPTDAERIGNRFFGDWIGRRGGATPASADSPVERTTVFIVDRPGAVQSEFRIGHVGLARSHPDFFPVLVMNTILGGAFTSRLNMSLRERHGFTYGARSVFHFRRRPGPFVVQAAVATDVTGPAVREAIHEMRLLRDDGPTTTELDAARDYLAGVLPLQLQTTDALAARLADLVVYDLPADYFDHYRERIAGVSADDVRRVASDHIHMDRLAVVVVGDAGQIEAPLRELGLGEIEIHAGR